MPFAQLGDDALWLRQREGSQQMGYANRLHAIGAGNRRGPIEQDNGGFRVCHFYTSLDLALDPIDPQLVQVDQVRSHSRDTESGDCPETSQQDVVGLNLIGS